MTFTVTYREKSGAKTEVEIEAANRAACVAECKARGIAPIAVREGRAASPKSVAQGGAGRAANVSAAPRGGTWKAAVLAAAVLAAIGVTWWWLAAREDARPPEPKADKVVKDMKDVKGVKAVKDLKGIKAAKGPSDAATNVATAASKATATNVAVVPKGPVYTNKVKALGHIEAIGIDGKPIPRRKPIFTKPLERALATGLMPVQGARGSVASRMRRFSDEQIIEMLKEPVTISKEDTESAIEAKLNVQELKERVLRHVSEGGNVRDVFEEIDNLACGAAHERHLTRVGLEEAIRLGDPEVVRTWVAARNAELRKLGMEEIRVPAKYREPTTDQPSKESSGAKENGEKK